MRGRGPDILPAMLFVRGDIHHAARTDLLGCSGDGDFERSLMNKNHLDVFMMMRGVWGLSRSELCLMALDGQSLMCLAVEHRAAVISDRQLVVGEDFGRQGSSLGGAAGCRCQGRK